MGHGDHKLFIITLITIPSDAEILLAEIGRLYRALNALPGGERPTTRLSVRACSPRYHAIEAAIRDLSARYRAIDPRLVLVADQA